MDAQQIMQTDDFKRCAAFHGHICPGLSLGFKAAKAAMEHLNENRSVDEEIIAIVENDACFVDAVQVLTGCTFGKGNFIFKDHGKMVLTVFSRNTGNGVRLALRPDAMKPGKDKSSSPEERMNITIKKVLETPAEQLFKIEEIRTSMPEKAQIHGSEICDVCGEAVMKTRIQMKGDKKLCMDCFSK